MDRELNQINVIPLVDVMLVLLVIVLTTATFITTGQIPVDLAKAKAAGDRKDVPLVITLTADGRLYLNDRPVTHESLKVEMTSRPRTISFGIVERAISKRRPTAKSWGYFRRPLNLTMMASPSLGSSTSRVPGWRN